MVFLYPALPGCVVAVEASGVAVSFCIEILSSCMAAATSCSVDPNRSPITLIACRMAVVIFAMCSSGVMGFSLLRAVRTRPRGPLHSWVGSTDSKATRRFSASLSVAIDKANTHTSMQSVVSPIISVIEHLSCHQHSLNLDCRGLPTTTWKVRVLREPDQPESPPASGKTRRDPS